MNMQQSVTDAQEPSPNDGEDCYRCRVFNFGRPKTSGQWIGHIAMAIIALFLVWWMLRVYVH
jgi:hypothetical protein